MLWFASREFLLLRRPFVGTDLAALIAFFFFFFGHPGERLGQHPGNPQEAVRQAGAAEGERAPVEAAGAGGGGDQRRHRQDRRRPKGERE